MRTGKSLSPILIAMAIFMAAAGCDSASPPVHTILTDSAGIAVATAVEPLWGPGEGWTVEPEPLLEIGTVTGAPEYLFTDVVAAVRLSNGDIVVAERAASELRSYDAAGNFQWRAGRSGEGPGEFRSLDFVGAAAGDSLVTYDGALLRAQVFDRQGRLARSYRVAITEGEGANRAAVADKAVGVVDGLLVVRFAEYGDEVPNGVVRWPSERLATLDLEDGAGRSLIVLPGNEASARVREDGGWSLSTYVFAKGPEFGAADGRLAVIDTEAWSVHLISPRDGATTAVFRREVAPREATAALFELHLDGIVEIAFADPDQAVERVNGLRRMWRGFPRAPHLPVLRSIHVDGTGHLWLQPYYVAGAEPPPFEILAPDGTWLGSVSLPPGLERGFIQYQAPYMEIGEDHVLGVWTDELDVQYVRMYRIDK